MDDLVGLYMIVFVVEQHIPEIYKERICTEIGICAIPDLIEAALDKTETVYQPQLSDILEADRLAREVVREKLN